MCVCTHMCMNPLGPAIFISKYMYTSVSRFVILGWGPRCFFAQWIHNNSCYSFNVFYNNLSLCVCSYSLGRIHIHSLSLHKAFSLDKYKLLALVGICLRHFHFLRGAPLRYQFQLSLPNFYILNMFENKSPILTQWIRFLKLPSAVDDDIRCIWNMKCGERMKVRGENEGSWIENVWRLELRSALESSKKFVPWWCVKRACDWASSLDKVTAGNLIHKIVKGTQNSREKNNR